MTMRLLIIILLFALCNNAFSEPISPPPVDDEITVPATLKTDPVQKIRLGKFVAEFEKTTLAEIRDALGSGSIEHSGDASKSQYWLCYSLPGQHIWFISHGEMGGANHVLTQVHAIMTSCASKVSAQCTQIPTRFQPISFNFGWIGISKENLFNLLGQPSGKRNGRFAYYYSGKELGVYHGQNVEWSVIGYIEAEIVDNKVCSLYVSHVTYY